MATITKLTASIIGETAEQPVLSVVSAWNQKTVRLLVTQLSCLTAQSNSLTPRCSPTDLKT